MGAGCARRAKLKDLTNLLIEMRTLSAVEAAKGSYLYGLYEFAQLLGFVRSVMILQRQVDCRDGLAYFLPIAHSSVHQCLS